MTLRLDPATTALVLIDLQKGILGMNLAPHGGGQVVAAAAAIGRTLKDAGGIVAVVRVTFSPDGRDRLAQPVDSPTTFSPGSLPADWAEIVPEIAALGAEVTVTKRHWGAFHGTELDLQLRRRRIETIVLGGVATNFGVESTAREAWQLGYSLVVVEDACTSVSDPAHRFAIETILPRIARVRSSAEIGQALRATLSASGDPA